MICQLKHGSQCRTFLVLLQERRLPRVTRADRRGKEDNVRTEGGWKDNRETGTASSNPWYKPYGKSDGDNCSAPASDSPSTTGTSLCMNRQYDLPVVDQSRG